MASFDDPRHGRFLQLFAGHEPAQRAICHRTPGADNRARSETAPRVHYTSQIFIIFSRVARAGASFVGLYSWEKYPW